MIYKKGYMRLYLTSLTLTILLTITSISGVRNLNSTFGMLIIYHYFWTLKLLKKQSWKLLNQKELTTVLLKRWLNLPEN